MTSLSPTSPTTSAPAIDTVHYTLADAIRAVPTWTSRSKSRRRGILSSLHKGASIIGKAPEHIPLDPPTLSAALTGKAAMSFGLQPKHYQNVLADFRCVLREFGISMPKPNAASITGPWAEVLAATASQWEKFRMSRFAAFCATHDIARAAVCAATVERFVDNQTRTEIVSKVGDRAYQAVKAWNAIAARRADLGLAVLPPRQRSNQYTLPISAFTASFVTDLDAWCRKAGRGDLSDIFAGLESSMAVKAPVASNHVRGSRHPVRTRCASTVALRCRQLIAAASALVLQGRDITTIRSLRDLVVPFDSAMTIARFHYERRSSAATSGIFGIMVALHQVAVDRVSDDPDLIERIGQLRERVRPKQQGIAARNRDRLRQLDNDRSRAALLHLPNKLLGQAAAAKRADARARLATCATALEILLVCPLRIGNLVRLRLDQHIRRSMHGRREITHIIIPADETKNGVAVEWPIPADSLPVLDDWLKNYRPAVSEPDSPWMFPGKGPNHRSISSMRLVFEEEIARCTGLQVHPHLLRHFGATLFLRHNPGQFESVRRVLGHKSLTTTVNSYLPMEADTAARRFDDVVLKERAATRLIARAASQGRRKAAKPAANNAPSTIKKTSAPVPPAGAPREGDDA